MFLFGYPWFHAAWEGLRFGFQLLYLLDASIFYSPELWLLGQSVARVSGTELVSPLVLPASIEFPLKALLHACLHQGAFYRSLSHLPVAHCMPGQAWFRDVA